MKMTLNCPSEATGKDGARSLRESQGRSSTKAAFTVSICKNLWNYGQTFATVSGRVIPAKSANVAPS